MKTTTFITLFILCFLNAVNAQNFSEIKKLRTYIFKSQETKILKGNSKERPKPTQIQDIDKIGNLAAVSLFYQNSCYTDGAYNHNDFKVEHGKIASGTAAYDAYRINKPAHLATNFLASNHCGYYKFPTKENYKVYQLNGKKIVLVTEILASKISVGKYTKIEEINFSQILTPEIYFFAPSSDQLSAFTQLSKNTEVAKIAENEIADVYKFKYKVANPIVNSLDAYNNSQRKLFLLEINKNQKGVVWQNQNSKNAKVLYLSLFNKDLKAINTIKLPNPIKGNLSAATTDGKGNVFYAITLDIPNATSRLTICKANASGKLITQKEQDCKPKVLNVFNFGSYSAVMSYANEKIAYMFARTLHTSSDGLNHQSGWAVVFDANNLTLTKNFGQTSGHSFDNILTTDSNNKFIGTDLGDNYPRGVHLHKFDDKQISHNIVVTFKTLHGTRPSYSQGMPSYPKYPEISKRGKQFYKWSNDNQTYTKLGGTHQVKGGYAVLFTSENSPAGKLLDNSRAGTNQDPMNIGFVKVIPNFETKHIKWNKVSPAIILSKGISEKGGFYTFSGQYKEQENHGIIWLTNNHNKEKGEVQNLKTALLTNGNLFLLWEIHKNRKYIKTKAMVINADGKIIHKAITMGENVRLSVRDELLVSGNNVYLATGNNAEQKLELIVFDMKP